MKPSKDAHLLEHIIQYCDEVSMTLEACEGNRERFEKSLVLRNACAMAIGQVGELAKHLSDDALTGMPEIPWRNVKGLRDCFDHGTHHLNVQIMWETALEDIPMFRKICCEYIKKVQNQ